MTTHVRSAGTALVAGVALGVAGDALLRAPGAPGLNLSAWIALAGAAGLLLRRRHGVESDVDGRLLVLAGVLCGGLVAWRDAPFLKLMAVGLTVLLFGLVAYRSGAAWIRRAGVGEYVAALAAGALHGAAGAGAAVVGVDWSSVRRPAGASSRWRMAAATARGIALVIPFVIVFGALFIAADAVFADMVAQAIRVDLETVASHVVLTGVIAWLATGCLYGFVNGTAVVVPGVVRTARPTLPIVETGVALAVLNALFLVFVMVQFRYLFGGADLVEVTAGLTYAEYARRGFFELVFVALLVLPTLLAADRLLRRERASDERVFRGLAVTLVVLVFAIMASAVQRLRLYVDAYGLTEQRFYAASLLAFLAIVFVWLVATVLRGRRTFFASGSLAAAFVVALTLFVLNPDAVIARTNLQRATGEAAIAFDGRYAATLSADAVPVLLRSLPQLAPAAACPVAERILERYGAARRPDLRSWSWSVHAARRAAGRHAATLQALVPADGCPADLERSAAPARTPADGGTGSIEPSV